MASRIVKRLLGGPTMTKVKMMMGWINEEKYDFHVVFSTNAGELCLYISSEDHKEDKTPQVKICKDGSVELRGRVSNGSGAPTFVSYRPSDEDKGRANILVA